LMARCFLSKFLSCCWRRNLTFASAEEEAAFKGSMEAEVVLTLLAFAGSGTCLCAVTWGQITQVEAERSDRPFPWPWSNPDARLLSFSAAFALLVTGMLTVATCALRLRGWFKRLNFEVLTVQYAVLLISTVFLCSKYHSAQACGVDPQDIWLPKEMHDGEVMCILVVLACVISVCLFIPIRSHIMWLVPFAGSTIYPLISVTIGTTMPASMPHIGFLITMLCMFLQVGGRRHEMQARRKWRAMQDATERDIVARGLEEMSWLSLEILMRLDVGGHIIMSGRKQDAFFGQPVQGKLFADLVAESDREHFSELLTKARSLFEVQSMPVAFELSFASVRAQLAILGVNGAETCFLVGLGQVEHTHKEEHMSPLNLHTIAEELTPPAPSEAGEAGLGGSAVASVVGSTATEKVFNDIDRLASVWTEPSSAGVREVFETLVDMGVREHWLVPTAEVMILKPCVVLGLGSYGCVALGRFRGTTVAIKAPRTNPLRSTAKTMSTFCNELRLLRRVRHSQIVAFYGAAIDPASGQLAMIFEYVEGQRMDLFVQQAHSQLLHREPPLLKLLIDVSTALAYLHGSAPPIVHGDIKSSNVQVQILDRGVVSGKLLDFGLSRLDTRRAKPLGGTTPWMAPELFTHGAAPTRPTPSADVFSFGLLVHFTVTSIAPTESYERNSSRSRFDRLRWPKSTVLREMAQALCRSCMLVHAAKRPAMQDVLHELVRGIRTSEDSFRKFGHCVVGMMAPAATWDDGIEALRDRVEGMLRSGRGCGADGSVNEAERPDPTTRHRGGAPSGSALGGAPADADTDPLSPEEGGDPEGASIIGL